MGVVSVGRSPSLSRPMFAHVNVEVDGRVERNQEVGDGHSLLPPNGPLDRPTFLIGRLQVTEDFIDVRDPLDAVA